MNNLEQNTELKNNISENNQSSSRSVQPVTNPVAQNRKPKETTKRTPKAKTSTKKSTKTATIVDSPAQNSLPKTNPLEKNREIVARINSISTVKSSNKMYGGYLNNSLSVSKKVINYTDIIRDLNTALQHKKTFNDLSNAIHSVFCEKLNCSFTAFGLFHEKSKCINLKLTNLMGSTYSSKVFLSETITF